MLGCSLARHGIVQFGGLFVSVLFRSFVFCWVLKTCKFRSITDGHILGNHSDSSKNSRSAAATEALDSDNLDMQ